MRNRAQNSWHAVKLYMAHAKHNKTLTYMHTKQNQRKKNKIGKNEIDDSKIFCSFILSLSRCIEIVFFELNR